MKEQLKASMCRYAKSLYDRGYTVASSGNLSVRCGDVLLVSGTNTSFGTLTPDQIAECNLDGEPLTGVRPSKEVRFHKEIYRRRPDVGAVVHLHSPYALALSLMTEPTDTGNVLPTMIREAVVRVGRLPMVEYILPGSARLSERVSEVCEGVNAMLLQSHGQLTFGPDLENAGCIAEELELCARLWFLTEGRGRMLTATEVAELQGVAK
ncbi:MAG TPA: class II aldolase/adducin family protein [Symbiobacteriaceae bacterium]|nr:class II aldolase/adducin family protein [Symbiobacteriaceae bacterium]